MRVRFLVVAFVTAVSVFQAFGQPPHHHPPGPPSHGPHDQPATATGQLPVNLVFDATRIGSPVVLDKEWRVGITPDPAAAKPDFDDSTWAVRQATEAIADVPDDDSDKDEHPRGHGSSNKRPYAWFRIHIKLAPGHGPVALLIEIPIAHSNSMIGSSGSDIAVFANGNQITPEGPHGSTADHYQDISRLYDLNVDPSQTSLTLAVRTAHVPFGMGAYTAFFATRTLRLGNPDDLRRSWELWSLHSMLERLPRMINSVLLVVLAVFLLALYFTQKGHPEYLWLALHELAQAPLGFIDEAGSSARLDQLWYAAMLMQLVAVSAYLYFEFLISFLALRRRWYIVTLRYTAPILAGVGPVLLLVGHSSVIGVCLAIIFAGSALWFVGWILFCFITLLAATAKRNFEAGLLLFPLVLTFIGILEPIFTSGMTDWGGGHRYHSPLTVYAGPVPVHFATIADFVGFLAIVLIIFVRFLRIQRDQERASSELEAARSVQELMIPHERLKTPGFEVDSVYNPANEVGGDFFHIESTPDGGLLVVIGDVAGKGLKAAMNVSMLMGALRRTPDRGPAKILESLNRVLVGSESFTTCQAAWFGADGEVVISNAGHLPPYLNSQEVFVPGGLPLGVVSEISYDEVRLYLHPGDRLLLMSNGVVEARQPSGELFGFARVHNLSSQSAFYIADAAKAFGQEDDITVLTVRRMPRAIGA